MKKKIVILGRVMNIFHKQLTANVLQMKLSSTLRITQWKIILKR